MITSRRNPDGSLTVGIIEEDEKEEVIIPIPEKKPAPKAEAKETKPKTTKKKTATK